MEECQDAVKCCAWLLVALATAGCAAQRPKTLTPATAQDATRDQTSSAPSEAALDEMRAVDQADALAQRGLQAVDARERQAALDAVRDDLRTGDSQAVAEALLALSRWSELPYDRAAMRALVLPHLDAPAGYVRRAAWYALLAVRLEPADAALAERLVEDEDPRVRADATRLLVLANNGLVSGAAEQAVLRAILHAPTLVERRQAILGLRSADLGPELQTLLLQLAREGDDDVLRVVYAALPRKSAATVQWLMETLVRDEARRARAATALLRGVPVEQQVLVAESALRALESTPVQRAGLYALLDAYAQAEHAPALLALCAGEQDCLRLAQRLQER